MISGAKGLVTSSTTLNSNVDEALAVGRIAERRLPAKLFREND